MTKKSKSKQTRVERRVKWINIAYMIVLVILATIIAIRLNIFANTCYECFAEGLANRIMLKALAILSVGYIACIPIMIYKVRQSKKIETDDDCDCDEGSCSY